MPFSSSIALGPSFTCSSVLTEDMYTGNSSEGPKLSAEDPHKRQYGFVKPPVDFPELPPAPPYPCPFLTDQEIHTYLTPLYRRTWTIQPSKPEQVKKPAPELVKRFTFASVRDVRKFLSRVMRIQASENHHAIQEVDEPSVTIRVHTHSGLRPASHPEEPRKARIRPGITLRDIRLAYLLEGAADKYGCVESRSRRGMLPEEQPRSAEALEARRHHSRK
ncbi:hypothetical protein C8T65DRAFT_652761 [Cerioporus squamosus]|nr:hypothetical protein C8T65DRAFT_652761 [Cerioporus squamosus]